MSSTVDFRLTDDQRALRQGIRALLEGRFGREALRAAVDRADGKGATPGKAEADGRGATGEKAGGGVLDRELWRELGAAGFFALCLPEADGGVGQGLPEAVLAFEEAGRVLLPGPLIATHLAAGAVPGAATGEVVVTSADGGLAGAGLVEWLDEADVVRGDATGAEPLAPMDPLTPLHRLPLPDRPAPSDRLLSSDRSDRSALSHRLLPPDRLAPSGRLPSADRPTPLHRLLSSDRLPPSRRPAPSHRLPVTVGRTAVGGEPRAAGAPDRLVASLLTAAEQLGSAARTCETAVQHARTREQFGRPVGAFQAVQHLCAGMLVRVEVARAAVYAASVTADPVDIAAARLLADEAAVRGARDCLQVHGGMGFTWESDVHLHLKRAWIRTHRAGGATQSEEELADDLVAGTA
ncbi:acyl-CoA dehydrogenase [Streptomyces sp. NPDC005281]|uniref:acyl-CoA dehydrogenase family protein n=1 Tax=Streptomyces sp. NPDC005281 TaxID=3155712 RepID=UPI0033B09739